jgi:hypothetical protein
MARGRGTWVNRLGFWAASALCVIGVAYMASLTASRGEGASQASEIMNHGGRKGGPQGIQHRQNVDDFLADGAADWA